MELVEDLKNYLHTSWEEDKYSQLEKLIELLTSPISNYLEEGLIKKILDENNLLDEDLLDDILENDLDIVNKALYALLECLEDKFDYIYYPTEENEKYDDYVSYMDMDSLSKE